MQYPDLAQLLKKRLEVIADHELRDRDPEAHLQELSKVSTAIMDWHQKHRQEIDSNLEHFLSGASYDKALSYLSTGIRKPCS